MDLNLSHLLPLVSVHIVLGNTDAKIAGPGCIHQSKSVTGNKSCISLKFVNNGLICLEYQLCLLTWIISHHVRLTEFLFLPIKYVDDDMQHLMFLLEIQECDLYQDKRQFFLTSQLCCQCHFRRMLLGVSQHQGLGRVGGPKVDRRLVSVNAYALRRIPFSSSADKIPWRRWISRQRTSFLIRLVMACY